MTALQLGLQAARYFNLISDDKPPSPESPPPSEHNELPKIKDRDSTLRPSVVIKMNKQKRLSEKRLLESSGYDRQPRTSSQMKEEVTPGTVVNIYSSSKKHWLDGTVKEIKGTLVCIVYGGKMKWLAIDSKTWSIKKQQPFDDHNANLPVQSITNSLSNDDSFRPPPPSGPPPVSPSLSTSINTHSHPESTRHSQQKRDHHPHPNHVPVPVHSGQHTHGQKSCSNSFSASQHSHRSHRSHSHSHQSHHRNHSRHRSKRKLAAPKPNEFDYEVTFTSNVLGIELYPDRSGNNCVITKCVSKKAKRFIDEGSIIVAINGTVVLDTGYEVIRDALSESKLKPPVNLTLRIKIGNIRSTKGVSERIGILKIKIVSALELKHPATHCVIEMNGIQKTTKQIERNEMPEWHQTVSFKGFKPKAHQMAKVTVYDHGALFGEKVIGTAEFEVPTHFAKLGRHDLELKSPTTGHLHGVILLRSVIVENARMTPDDFEMDSNGKIPANSNGNGHQKRLRNGSGNGHSHRYHDHHNNHRNGIRSDNHHVNGHRSDYHHHHQHHHNNEHGNNQPVPHSASNPNRNPVPIPVPAPSSSPYAMHQPSAPTMMEELEVGNEIKEWFENQVNFNQSDKMKYCQLLIESGFENLVSLKYLGESQLKEIGVTKLGHRHMILAALKEL